MLIALAIAAPPSSASDRIDALSDSIAVLRARGLYHEAEAAARDLLPATVEVSAQAHVREDAARLLTTLSTVAGMPQSERRDLAFADSLALEVSALMGEWRLEEAAAAAEAVLYTRERILGPDHIETAEMAGLLGVIHLYEENAAEAEPLLRRALSTRRSVLGTEHPDVAADLGNLAQVHLMRGRHDEAEQPARESVAIYLRVAGDDPNVGFLMSNLAAILQTRGDFASAEPLAREGLARTRTVLGGDAPEVAMLTANLASLEQRIGNTARAEELLREAISLQRSIHPGDHPNTSIYLNNLAEIQRVRGDHDDAERACREALEMRRSLSPSGDPDLGITLQSLSRIRLEQGDPDEAADLAREAVEVFRRTVGASHHYTASAMYNLGLALALSGDGPGGERALLECLELRRLLLGSAHPYTVLTAGRLGAIRLARGDFDSADSLLESAARDWEAARLRAGTGVARASFLESPWPLLAASRLKRGAPEDAWPAAERDLGRVLADLLAGSGRRQMTAEEQADSDSLRRALRRIEGEIAALASAYEMEAAHRDSLLRESRTALLTAEARWSDLHRRISSRDPVAEPASLERVGMALGPDAAILGWLDVEIEPGFTESWGYVLRKDRPVLWVQLAPVDRTRIASYRRLLSDPSSPLPAANRDGRRLWAERIEPLLSRVPGTERLIIIPSGGMLGVPVEALIDTEGRTAAERFTISYSPSATLFTALTEGSSARDQAASAETEPVSMGGRPRRALLLGDPPFQAQYTDGRPRPGLPAALRTLPRLEASREEVESIAGLVKEPTILLGEDADEQTIARMAASGELGRYGIIHFSTHGLMDDERPERSALVLSQASLADPVESVLSGDPAYDGLISAAEIVREWSLDADLIALSACESALGKEIAGEGYIGLAHAFFSAGARSVLVSLWKVDDRATALLMIRFYENWLGESLMSRADALREARRWLRDTVDEHGSRPYAHPFFWAGFILIGDPG